MRDNVLQLQKAARHFSGEDENRGWDDTPVLPESYGLVRCFYLQTILARAKSPEEPRATKAVLPSGSPSKWMETGSP